MSKTDIEFYFDFSSPFAYLASTWLEELAERYDRKVKWVPIMLGSVFKETGMKPLFHQPIRGEYGRYDFLRSAHLLGEQVVVPKEFPYLALKVSRAFFWIEKSDPARAIDFAKAVFRCYFVEGVSPTTDEVVSRLAREVGVDEKALTAAVVDPEIKQVLKDQTSMAMDKGVFGAPFIIVDGEPFWGNDRKEQIEQWLKTGGWKIDQPD